MLQGLGVELDEFERDRGDGYPALEPKDPSFRRVDTVLEARWEPACTASPILEPGGAVTQVGRSAATPVLAALCEGLANLRATML